MHRNYASKIKHLSTYSFCYVSLSFCLQMLLADFFPLRTSLSSNLHHFLVPYIQSALSDLQINSTEQLISKILQLYTNLESRHGLMLVGDAGSGKSIAIEALRKSMVEYHADKGQGKMVKLYTLNPKVHPTFTVN